MHVHCVYYSSEYIIHHVHTVSLVFMIIMVMLVVAVIVLHIFCYYHKYPDYHMNIRIHLLPVNM